MSNLFTLLKKILPDAPLLVGVVQSVSTSGCFVALPTGGVIFARGQAAVDDSVFVRDGVIEGTAPALTIEVIEV